MAATSGSVARATLGTLLVLLFGVACGSAAAPVTPTPTRILTPTPTLSPAEIVKREFERLSPGQILFSAAKEMTLDVKERVEVRIAKGEAVDLGEGLKGRGEPQVSKIRVNTFMAARLAGGDEFDIKALNNEEQFVEDERYTQWNWDVVPLQPGISTLYLTVSVRIKIPDHDEERKDYPVFEKQVKVRVSTTSVILKWLSSHWQWVITTILGSGAFGWIITYAIRRSRKSTT